MTETNTTDIVRVKWSLFGPEREMRDAENAARCRDARTGCGADGAYLPMFSYRDWEPFDDDDYEPPNVESRIDFGHDTPPDIMAEIWKIAAILGASASIRAHIESPSCMVVVNSDEPGGDLRLFRRIINAELSGRIDLAMKVLRGDAT